jgi:AbrB family looped-hinge helix DNA binding protein
MNKDSRETKRAIKPEPVRIDGRGRISLPKRIREAMHLESGDTLFLRQDGDRLEVRKAENPFDVLAHYAVKEYEAGRTKSIQDVARDLGVDLSESE